MDERARIIASNELAAIVFEVAQKHGLFAYLHLRYDIADAILAAGYSNGADHADRSQG